MPSTPPKRADTFPDASPLLTHKLVGLTDRLVLFSVSALRDLLLATAAVQSFAGRQGAVTPQPTDYTVLNSLRAEEFFMRCSTDSTVHRIRLIKNGSNVYELVPDQTPEP